MSESSHLKSGKSMEEEKITVAIENPKIKKDRTWLYNIFLGRITNNKDRNEKKVNFIMDINRNDIARLEERGCRVYILGADGYESTERKENNSIFKKMSEIFVNVFEEAMKDEVIYEKIRAMLFEDDGSPRDNYLTIMQGIEELNKEE